MRILVATDAWHPQVNGVVRTLTMMAQAAEALGHEIVFLTPESFRTFAMPSYRDLRLALPRPAKVAKLIAKCRPDSIHIATEGPIGLLVRRHCRKRDLPFTTSFHTRFPDYVAARAPVPEAWVWASLRWFHGPSQAVMAATPALAGELKQRGFANVVLWPRGVDTALFRPREVDLCLPEPVFLCVGRVAVEKNLAAFLALDLPGTKVIVGDGPARAELERDHPDAVFLGALQGEALAKVYAAARSAGLGLAGRGISGGGSARRDRHGRGWRARRGSGFGLSRRAHDFATGLRDVCRQSHLGCFDPRFHRPYGDPAHAAGGTRAG
jgi:glycosyltransferase involved in cell wall biosynthesis